MISIFDFKKSSGEKIPDIVEYVKNYVKTHSNIDVIVGTDSQVDHSKTVFSTVVAMYDRGDGEHGHGAHCISKSWFLPKYRKEQRIDRLLKETEESINIAKALRENGVKIKYIDIDIRSLTDTRKGGTGHGTRTDTKTEVFSRYQIHGWTAGSCTPGLRSCSGKTILRRNGGSEQASDERSGTPGNIFTG